MRLTSYTDYALRLLMFLAVDPTQAHTVAEISTAFGISRNHLTKVAHALGRAGLIDTVRGRKGGLRLGRKASLIKLGEVVGTTEAAMTLVECFGAGGNCIITPVCKLRHALAEAHKSFLDTLDSFTLADITTDPNAFASLLGLPSAQV